MLQVPLLGFQLKLVPVVIGVVGTILAARSYFQVIFIQGGVGRNGSTVAVSRMHTLPFQFSCRILAMLDPLNRIGIHCLIAREARVLKVRR